MNPPCYPHTLEEEEEKEEEEEEEEEGEGEGERMLALFAPCYYY